MKTHHITSGSTLFKSILLLIAVTFAAAATLLIILSTSAATVTGSSPFLSVSLVKGANTGILSPGEQRWFRLSLDEPDQSASVEQSLTLVYTPGDEPRSSQVALQIFEEKELASFFPDDTSQMTNLGAGQIVTRDNNPQTGELFWTGWLPTQASYYIQLANSTGATIDYWLITDDVSGYPLGEPAAITIPASATPAVLPTPVPASGSTPQDAITLNFGQNQGNLNPGQEIWYKMKIADSDNEFFEETALTLITTPNQNQQGLKVELEIFSSGDIQNWINGVTSKLNNMGAGSVVTRDNNPLTGEQFWTGWIIDSEVYYVRVRNGADVPVDYWLFTGDIYNPKLGNRVTP